MNYNNGFQFLAATIGFFSAIAWIVVMGAISEGYGSPSKKWLFLPATTTILALIFGFLAAIGAGRP